MNYQYYAVCNVNGPISVSIEADSIDTATAVFSELDHQGMIDAAESDAEDDLDIAGTGMSEDDFDEVMESAGYTVVADLAQIHNYHSGTSRHLLGGWRLYGEIYYKQVEVCGIPIEYDGSGVGHNWLAAREVDCDVDAQEEIAAEIIDGGMKSCDDFIATGGYHYRW